VVRRQRHGIGEKRAHVRVRNEPGHTLVIEGAFERNDLVDIRARQGQVRHGQVLPEELLDRRLRGGPPALAGVRVTGKSRHGGQRLALRFVVMNVSRFGRNPPDVAAHARLQLMRKRPGHQNHVIV